MSESPFFRSKQRSIVSFFSPFLSGRQRCSYGLRRDDAIHRRTSERKTYEGWNALELPPERVRGWMNGGMPDCVRGIHTAGDLGWLDCKIESDDTTWMAFVTAVTWIFSGGSISTADYRPRFAVEQDTEPIIRDALQTLSVRAETRHEELDSRATEVVPASHAPLLGRALTVLDAPVGPKTDQRLSLPSWLQQAPTPVREHFAEIYLQNRGTEHEGKATLTVGEDRSKTYRKELAAFLSETLNVDVTAGER